LGAERADIERRARERVGAVLRGKYRLDRLLGVGGMGSVFAATHTNNKNRVAIKILHAELSLNTEVRARFLREGYVANTVEHPGAVRVLDDDATDDGAVFLVSDLLDGETLQARWERHVTMAKEDVALVAIQLLDVLSAAHAKGILHRDVKPENVFLTRTGGVKVLDFGIARLREGGAHDSITSAGQMVGTPAFMAPEQALGRDDLGPQADVWAVGATMFALLTARFVHEARTNSELLVFTATRPPRPIASVDASVSPPLAAIIDKALSFDPADRWPDARAMQRALRELLREWCPNGHRLPASPSAAEALALEDTQSGSRRNIDAALAAPRLPRESHAALAGESGEAFAPTISSGALPAASTTTGGVASSRGGDLARAARRGSRMRHVAVTVAVVGVLSIAGIVAVALARRGDSTAGKGTPTMVAAPVDVPASTAATVLAAAPSVTAPAVAPSATTPALAPPTALPSSSQAASHARGPAPSPPASPPALPAAARRIVPADPLDRQ
jgi:serine/threonine-protein kinase